MENKECCKWCGNCMIIDIESGEGKCYDGIGDYVDINNDYCSGYYYDEDLNRC